MEDTLNRGPGLSCSGCLIRECDTRKCRDAVNRGTDRTGPKRSFLLHRSHLPHALMIGSNPARGSHLRQVALAVPGSQHFEQTGSTHAAADAHGDDDISCAPPPAFDESVA